MKLIKKLEDKLASLFENVPALPTSSREALVNLWPWIALVFGALQLLAAWALVGMIQRAENFVNYDSFYIRNPDALSGAEQTPIYLGILVLIVEAIILLRAYPELKMRSRFGWELLFLASLLNVLYSLIGLFIQSRGIGTFIFSLISSAVGFYLLFQVRGYYKMRKAAKNKKTF